MGNAATGLYVVTGSSRGLGAALVAQLLHQGHTVLGIARHPHDTLPTGPALTQWALDLADPAPAATRLGEWLATLDGTRFSSANLVNNAGVLSRIGPIDDTSSEDLSTALRVGLEAPMLLTAAFLRATLGWPGVRRVLNISSGLGRRAMAGSASYCAAKAGLDHFTRCTALDEAERPNGARVVSLAPGVIDTDMQVSLRGSDPEGFPERDSFVRLKSDGKLASPGDTATRVLAFLHRADFGDKTIADIRTD
jgi:NAD(P)-dependent dehydrogenase (short-subunit alcohol dehydrogenase family)